MKLTKRRRRAARKLVLPLVAIGLMTTMMYLDSIDRPQPPSGSHAPAAARVPHDLQRR